MIKVFYSGYGYAFRVNDRGYVDHELQDATFNHYKAYFCIDAEIAEHLKHFDNFTARVLNFIDGNLPRGITREQAEISKFLMTSVNHKWRTKFELERAKEKYDDESGNKLKVFWNDDEPAPQNTTVQSSRQELTKLEQQHAAILAVIKMKGFDAMRIPDGGKGTIEDICRSDYPLLFDGETSFKRAWTEGRHLFKMANHESYVRRATN